MTCPSHRAGLIDLCLHSRVCPSYTTPPVIPTALTITVNAPELRPQHTLQPNMLAIILSTEGLTLVGRHDGQRRVSKCAECKLVGVMRWTGAQEDPVDPYKTVFTHLV